MNKKHLVKLTTTFKAVQWCTQQIEHCQGDRGSVRQCHTWRALTSVRESMGARPAFSARAIGTFSSASAKARIAYCSMPGCVSAASLTAVVEHNTCHGQCSNGGCSIACVLERTEAVGKGRLRGIGQFGALRSSLGALCPVLPRDAQTADPSAGFTQPRMYTTGFGPSPMEQEISAAPPP